MRHTVLCLYLDSSFICPHVQKLQSNLEVMPLNAGSKLIDPTSLSWCKLDSDARAPLAERPYLVCGHVCSTRTIEDLHVCFTETAQLVPRKHVQVAYRALKLCFSLLLPLGSNVPERVGEGWKKGRALPVTLVVGKGLVTWTMKWYVYTAFDVLRLRLKAVFASVI